MSGGNIRDLNIKGNKPPIATPLSNHEAQRYILKKTNSKLQNNNMYLLIHFLELS